MLITLEPLPRGCLFNLFYRLGSEIILAALVRFPEVLPTLATCAGVYFCRVGHVHLFSMVATHANIQIQFGQFVTDGLQ